MRVTAATILVATLAGCGGSVSPGPDADVQKLPATIQLQPGEERVVTGNIVRFIEVKEDSRCPVDVVCAWAGNAALLLSVGPTVGEEPIQLITLNTISNEPVLARGLTFRLVKLDPAPVSTVPTKNYRVEIRIEHSIQSGMAPVLGSSATLR